MLAIRAMFWDDGRVKLIMSSAASMRIYRWLRRHPLLVVAATAFLVTAAIGLNWWYWPSVPTASVEKVQSIEIYLMPVEISDGIDLNRGQDEVRVTITDSAQIGAFLDLFRAAEQVSEHKCGASGTITIRRKDGATEEIGILPGHDPAYYEYRYGGRINRVNRESLLAALRAVGIRQVKLAPP